ncbi:MAG: LuxR C-terminal-related transcriptional regulator [Coriobacteriales bacterium]|jgi:DNA-binding CsgD family transcriptional regulator
MARRTGAPGAGAGERGAGGRRGSEDADGVAAGAADGEASGRASHAEGAADGQPEGAVLFPMRLLGVGLVFTWDWCVTSLPGGIAGGSAANGTLASTALVVAQLVALVLLACLSRTVGPLSGRPWLTRAACAAGVAGQLLCAASWASGMAGAQAALELSGGALMGASLAVLQLSWAEVYGRLEPSRVMVFGSLSLLAGTAVYALVAQSSAVVQAASLVGVPLASFAACAASRRFVGGEPAARTPGVRYTFPWKPVLIMGTCGFTAAFVDVSLFSQGTLPHVLADAVVGGAVCLAVVVLRRSVRPVWLVGASLACMAAAVACVAVLGAASAFPASLLAMTAYAGMTLFTCALLADICRRRDIPSMWLFGFALAARVLTDHLGGFASMLFPGLPSLAGSPADLAIAAVAGMVMIGVVAMVWMSERSFSSDWAIRAIDASGRRRRPSEHEVLLAGCARAAADAGLTEREAEVLEMLMEGRTYQQMCSRLLLSANTVKTHTRHMYAKLGVHTRAEALELVRAAGRRELADRG